MRSCSDACPMYTLPKASSCPDTHWLSTLTDPEITALSVSSMVLPSVRVSLPAMRSFRVGERIAARYSFGTSYIFVVYPFCFKAAEHRKPPPFKTRSS